MKNFAFRNTTHQFVVAAMVCLPIMVIGCSSSDSQSGSNSGLPPARMGVAQDVVIPLESNAIMYYTGAEATLDAYHPGLVSPGDIDGDGIDDLVVGTKSGLGNKRANCTIYALSGSNGGVIWTADGRFVDKQGKYRGAVEQIYLIDDLDGDQIPDILGRQQRTDVEIRLVSGKSGRLIAEHSLEGSSHPRVARPVASVRDRQGKATDGPHLELFAVEAQKRPQVYYLAPSSFATIRRVAFAHDEADVRKAWAATRFGDDDGDGILDHLVRVDLKQSYTDDVYQYEMHIVSGKDFRTIRTFLTDRPRTGTHDEGYAALGDVDGDGVADFAYGCGTGATANRRASHVRAFSGSNGTKLWEVNGMQIEGQTIITVPVAPGTSPSSSAQSWNDCGFNGRIISVPDRNRDSVADLVTMIQTRLDGRTRTQMIVLSGKDGSLLAIRDPANRPIMTRGFKLVALAAANRRGDPGVAFALGQQQRKAMALHICPIPEVQ